MLDPGTPVGPYVIEVLVGMGGMGAVYRARDTRLGRAVCAACAGGALVYAGMRRTPAVAATARPSAPPSAEARAAVARASAPSLLAKPPTASAAPAAPVACAAAARPAPPSAHASASARRSDVLTNCLCVGDVKLCPLGTDTANRECECKLDGEFLVTKQGGASSTAVGKGLTDGQPCHGFDEQGALGQGALTECVLGCDHQTFRGLHRARCRGLDRRGHVTAGVLMCY